MSRLTSHAALVLVFVVASGVAIASSRADEPMAPMEALAKAQVDGKYGNLLRQFKVDDESPIYGEYYDYGRYSGSSYRGLVDLPAGYWVWVKPHWFIWGESGDVKIGEPAAVEPAVLEAVEKRLEGAKAVLAEPPAIVLLEAAPVAPAAIFIEEEEDVIRGPLIEGFVLDDGFAAAPAVGRWTPDQATGPPNTLTSGDQVTAWASSTQDGAEEWLELEYAEAITPAKVLVYETYNPGALIKVVAYTETGMDSEVWSGRDPVVIENGMGVAEIAVAAALKTKKIRIHLDSKGVAGWNEIDAVGLVDAEGKTHWAVKATASTTYGVAAGAEDLGGPFAPPVDFGPAVFPGEGLPDVPLPAEILVEGPFDVGAAPGGLPFFPMPVGPGAGGEPDPRDVRIQSLEETVKSLQDQIDALRRQIEAAAPPAGAAGEVQSDVERRSP